MIRQDSINRVLSEYQQRRVIEVEARALSLLEGIHDDLDPEMKGWSLAAGQTGRFDEPKSITLGTLDTQRTESQRSFYRNPYGRNIINTYVKFIIGRGIIIDFKEKNEETLLSIMEWWNRFALLNKWFSLQRETVIRSLRDGETFVRKFSMPGNTPMVLRFVDPERVNSSDLEAPYGIETDPKDVENIIAYHVQRGAALDRDRIPAEDVIHIKLGVDRNVRRGRPLLESMLPYIAKYEKWLDARMVLNIVRTSVALVRHVKGSPTNLANLRSATASQTTQKETDRTKMLRSGTIITATPGVEYDMLSPNLDARDAAQDGRTILLALAAAAGLPDIFVTADYQNSNFACHSMDTEALTKRGWLRFDDFKKDDYLATINPVTSALEFQNPDTLYVFPYQGEMYTILSEGLNFCVTPTHQMMIATHCAPPLDSYIKIPIKDIFSLKQKVFFLPQNMGDGHPQMLKPELLRRMPYNDRVWCATVPNGLLITRRNGTPLISGNSTVVAQNPAIRLFEEYQQLYSEAFSQIIMWALEDGVEKGEIPSTANLDHDISYPPLLKRDLLNEVNAWEKIIDLQLSSRRTASLNLGIDPDQEKKMMAEETPLPITKPKRPATVPKRVEDRKPRDNVQV